MDSTVHKRCLNCDHPIADEAFCPACGQRTKLPRITFKETFADFLSSSFSLEGPFWRTMVLLFRNPGRLFRDYLSGKRKRYYKPVAFFIVNTAIYLLLGSIIGYDPLAHTNIQLTYDDVPTLVNQTAQAARFMVGYINHILLFLVLAIGLMCKLFFRKRYRLAEYIAVGFYIVAFYLAMGNFTVLASHYVLFALKYVNFLILITYITVMLPSFFEDKRPAVYFKSFLVACFSLFLYMVLAFGGCLGIVLLRGVKQSVL